MRMHYPLYALFNIHIRSYSHHTTKLHTESLENIYLVSLFINTEAKSTIHTQKLIVALEQVLYGNKIKSLNQTYSVVSYIDFCVTKSKNVCWILFRHYI